MLCRRMGDGSIVVNTVKAEWGVVFLVHCDYRVDAFEELEGSLFEPWLLMMLTLGSKRCTCTLTTRTRHTGESRDQWEWEKQPQLDPN